MDEYSSVWAFMVEWMWYGVTISAIFFFLGVQTGRWMSDFFAGDSPKS